MTKKIYGKILLVLVTMLICKSTYSQNEILTFERDKTAPYGLEDWNENCDVIKFFPKSTDFLAISDNNSIKEFNSKGETVKTFVGLEGEAFGIKISSDGSIIVAFSKQNNTICCWKRNGELINKIKIEKPLKSIDISPNSKLLAFTYMEVFEDYKKNPEDWKKNKAIFVVKNLENSEEYKCDYLLNGINSNFSKLYFINNDELVSFFRGSQIKISYSTNTINNIEMSNQMNCSFDEKINLSMDKKIFIYPQNNKIGIYSINENNYSEVNINDYLDVALLTNNNKYIIFKTRTNEGTLKIWDIKAAKVIKSFVIGSTPGICLSENNILGIRTRINGYSYYAKLFDLNDVIQSNNISDSIKNLQNYKPNNASINKYKPLLQTANKIKEKGKYMQEYITGCLVYNPNSLINDKEDVIWFGKIINGYAEGEGKLFWFKNGIYNGKTEGQYIKGKFNGNRKSYSPSDILMFEGNNLSGKFYNNEGKLIYEGSLKENSFNGFGTLYNPEPKGFANGFVEVEWKGNWLNGKKNGWFNVKSIYYSTVSYKTLEKIEQRKFENDIDVTPSQNSNQSYDNTLKDENQFELKEDDYHSYQITTYYLKCKNSSDRVKIYQYKSDLKKWYVGGTGLINNDDYPTFEEAVAKAKEKLICK